MADKRKGTFIAGLVVAGLAVGGGAIAVAGGGDDDETDRPIRGAALDRASAAALEHTGGGRVTETERGDEEGAYEVEVTREDGSQVDVHLDRSFEVIGTEGEEGGEDDGAAHLPRGNERVRLDPAGFTTRVDNPYLPMRPGSRWVYRETDDGGTAQRIVVKVLRRTKRIANGVEARVVRDTVTEKGVLVEDTFDWYAQDRAGNVWYLGEDTTEYEDGRPVTKAGSFEAGVDGAQAGVVMPARPRPGLEYRQESYPGEAEDAARVLSLDDQVQVPAGHFRPVLMTKDWNPLEPGVLEYKLYARGVGLVLALGVSDGGGREELLRYTPGR
jgi:hypothetical protein